MITQHLPKTQAWSTQGVRTKPGPEMQPSRTVDGQAHKLSIHDYTCYKCEALVTRVDHVYSILYWQDLFICN